MKVFEWLAVAFVIKMAARSIGDECAVLDFPRALVFLGDFPAVKCLAVHERGKTRLNFGPNRGCSGE
jgi:hypothetical protein